jgi:hypothetical protein
MANGSSVISAAAGSRWSAATIFLRHTAGPSPTRTRRALRDGRSIPASAVPAASGPGSRTDRVRIVVWSRPAASSAKSTRRTSACSQRCVVAFAITSGAALRTYGSRRRRSSASSSSGSGGGVARETPGRSDHVGQSERSVSRPEASVCGAWAMWTSRRAPGLPRKAPELAGQSKVVEDPLVVVASVRLPVGSKAVAPPNVRELAQLRDIDGGSWSAPAEPSLDVLFRPEEVHRSSG